MMINKYSILISFLVLLLSVTNLNAQRTIIVDVSTILEKMDEYQRAQQELDRTAAEWRQEIAKEYDEIKSMYNKYQAEQVLLSDEERTQREEAIMEKEKQVRELQKQRFGPEGDLFRKRQELVQPIQDKVYDAIEEYADQRQYDLIFDKSGTAGIIYSNPELEKTDEIMRRLGLK